MISRIRGLRDDAGAMLIVALIVITSVAVVTGAVLSQSWTNIRATETLRGVAGTSYAADTGAKVAINNLRLGASAPGWVAPTYPGAWANWVYTNNADGTGCFGADGTAPKKSLELKNLYPKAGTQSADTSVRVECSPVAGTGIFGAGAGVTIQTPLDAFQRALTTVGTSGSWQGMTLKPLGTGNSAAMPIRGGIASKSFINVTNGALVTDGYVKAEGACTGQIISTPAAACNAPGTVPVPAAPASPLTSVPVYRNPADYASSCVFQPGFYNNAKALSDAVNGCSTAKFAPNPDGTPGKYYFDFVDERHGAPNVWNITTTVIGGEYVGGNIPGACKSPIKSPVPVSGVQFVFGANSRMTIGDTAHVELCGPSSGGQAPMTLFQEQAGSTEASVPLPAVSAGNVDQLTGNVAGDKWTTGTVAPTTTSATPVKDAIAAADASTVTWTIAGNNDDVGLNLRDFPGLAAIPAGSDISSAELKVKYAKTSARPLQVTVQSQTPADVPVSAPDATGWGTAQLADQMRNLLASGAFDANKPTLQLRMMNASAGDTLTMDAVTLSITYVPPSLRKAVDNQFIYSPGGNFHGEFVVNGATYLPNGYVDIDPGSFTTALVAFRWGLVALGVDFTAQPSQEFGYPLVSLPDAGLGLGSLVTVVDLKVYVCAEQATCASGGKHAITARVMITDPPYADPVTGAGAPVPGKRKIEVLSWAEQN